MPRLQKNGISEISPLATDLGRRQNRLVHWKLALELEIAPQGPFGLGRSKIPNGSAGGSETKIRFCIYRQLRLAPPSANHSLWPSGMAAGLTTKRWRVQIPVRSEFFFGLWLMVLPFCTAFGSWIPWGCDLQGTCGPCEGPPTAAWTICARPSPKSPPGQLAAGHRPEGPSWTQQASRCHKNATRAPRDAPRTTLVDVAPQR